MAPGKRSALILYYSCTGNTAGLAEEAAAALGEDGWSVQKSTLRKASEKLKTIPDFLVVGVPVHYWTVPSAASLMLKKLPALNGTPAFVFCAYGGCVHHNVTQQLASELSAKGAVIAGGAVVLTPHSCPSADGKRLGDIDELFGMNEPRPSSLHEFKEAIRYSAEQTYKTKTSLSPESLRFSNAGYVARFMNRFVSLEMKKSSMPSITYNQEKCTGCGKCISTCTAGIYTGSGSGKISILKGSCDKCFACAMNCPTGALSSNWKMVEKMSRVMHKLANGSGSTIYTG